MSSDTPSPPSHEPFGRLVTAVEQRFGIVIPPERHAAVQRTLSDSCDAIGAGDLSTLAELVAANDAKAVDHLISAATVNHTGFMREPETYDLFAGEILESLKRAPQVRVWSAAASTGEELYSLAMVIADRIGLPDLERRWRLLGTDIDSDALRTAEHARYPVSRVARVPESLRSQYLTPASSKAVVVHDRLQKLCTFRRFNLLARPLPFRNPFQVVWCRNVLYYFSERRQRDVLATLHQATAPGGWLIIGASEPIEHLDTLWKRVSPVAYRRGI